MGSGVHGKGAPVRITRRLMSLQARVIIKSRVLHAVCFFNFLNKNKKRGGGLNLEVGSTNDRMRGYAMKCS